MSLSCECSEPDWFYHEPNDFKPMPFLTKRKRCCSCKKILSPGEPVLEFKRDRPTMTPVEDEIYGGTELVPLANYYHCEVCGGLFFALDELGYCFSPDEPMKRLVKEYNEIRERDLISRKAGRKN